MKPHPLNRLARAPTRLTWLHRPPAPISLILLSSSKASSSGTSSWTRRTRPVHPIRRTLGGSVPMNPKKEHTKRLEITEGFDESRVWLWCELWVITGLLAFFRNGAVCGPGQATRSQATGGSVLSQLPMDMLGCLVSSSCPIHLAESEKRKHPRNRQRNVCN